VIERATWPDERVVVTTLRDIAETALHAEIAAPALFVIGNVVDAGVRSNGRKNGQRHTHLQGSTR
jgi:siroheme synthase